MYPTNNPNHLRWQSGTGGHPGAWTAMQTDGNFVIYTSTGQALWATGTNSSANVNSTARITSDGNLVIKNGSGTSTWSACVQQTAQGWGDEIAFGYSIFTNSVCLTYIPSLSARVLYVGPWGCAAYPTEYTYTTSSCN